MRDWIETKLRKKLSEEIRCTHQRIIVEPCRGLFNFQCFDNAVDYTRLYPDTRVIEVIYIKNDYPILHYINQKEDGTYLETTLGWQADYCDYWYIREIHPTEYKFIGPNFDKTVDLWSNKYLRWYHRYILRIDRLV